MKHVGERETVLLGQCDVQAIVGGRGLQFEIEAAAEALAQSQAPGLVDASAEGSVNHQLHAAAFVKETLGDDGVLRRHVSQHCPPLQDVFNRLLGAGVVQAALFFQPGDGFGHFRLRLRDADTGRVLRRRSLISFRKTPRGKKVLGCAPELRRARREL